MRFSGIPHNPNPPTHKKSPSLISLTAYIKLKIHGYYLCSTGENLLCKASLSSRKERFVEE
jgi:hypothetical protein